MDHNKLTIFCRNYDLDYIESCVLFTLIEILSDELHITRNDVVSRLAKDSDFRTLTLDACTTMRADPEVIEVCRGLLH